ncbi:MAG: OmpA family protein [Chitinophagaceae bacterium]|nr:OmpA family protein [Chitinophagaceae bacterium]
MNRIFTLLALMCIVSSTSWSQMRIGVAGGPQSASVKQDPEAPGFGPKSGLHLGLVGDIPLTTAKFGTGWHFQPGLMYSGKGRDFYSRIDSLTATLTDTLSISHTLSVNYIEMPFYLTYKFPIGKKARLIVGAGPYLGFFFNGKQAFETKLYQGDESVFNNEEIKLEAGKEPGKVKTFDAGFNAKAGIEIGNFYLAGFMSRGLSNFYTSSIDATYKHKVAGATIGIYLNKVKQPAKKFVPPLIVMDRDSSVFAITAPNEIPSAIKEEPANKYDSTEQLEKRLSFAAKNILFNANSDQLSLGSLDPLNEIASILVANTSLKLVIEGHTDGSGKADKNLILSQRRAESVEKYLIEQGVDTSRLEAIGYGSTRPVASEKTPEGRAANRRVELRIVH